MKVFLIGASLRSGISAKNNKPYTIAEVIYAIPDESKTKNDDDGTLRWSYTAYGYKTRTIELASTAIEAFKNVKALDIVDLKVEPMPENPSRNQCVGVVA